MRARARACMNARTAVSFTFQNIRHAKELSSDQMVVTGNVRGLALPVPMRFSTLQAASFIGEPGVWRAAKKLAA